MDRVNRIITGKDYQHYLLQNKAQEENRGFCHHDFEHMLTVARLTYMLLLERGERFISKEIAYAAGLLHDIGRYQEYRDGTDHARQSAVLAQPLLQSAGFAPDEQDIIISAITGHRNKAKEGATGTPLSLALREADLYARLCYRCRARPDCRSSTRRFTAGGLQY